MKRSGPPQRRTPLKQGKGLSRGDSSLRQSPLRQRSERRSDFMRETRAPAVAALAASGAPCRIGPLLSEADIHIGCTGTVQGLHERRKRSAGGSLVNPANLVPCCNLCNGWVEDEPEAARTLFGTALVVREGDSEWEQLGSRNDRA